jgi:hypothetical protein
MRWGSCTHGGPTDQLNDRVEECGWSAADARRDEFLLAVTAQNLRVLAKLIPILTLQPAIGGGRKTPGVS